jgi:penicillin-binding protein 1A
MTRTRKTTPRKSRTSRPRAARPDKAEPQASVSADSEVSKPPTPGQDDAVDPAHGDEESSTEHPERASPTEPSVQNDEEVDFEAAADEEVARLSIEESDQHDESGAVSTADEFEAGDASATSFNDDGGTAAARPAEKPQSHTVAALGALMRGVGRDARRLGSGLRRRRPAAGARQAAPEARRRKPLLLRLARGLVALVLIGVVAIGGLLVWALHDAPLADITRQASAPVVVLETADGAPLVQQGAYTGPQASLAEFPPHLVDAVLAIEDRRFYEHFGLDLRGIARASVRNAAAGEVVEGGSTITQQLLKILHLESDRTFKRKFQEAALAFYLESRLSKDEILTRYLNSIYLGAGATGMPAAARVYFDKEVGQLTVSESAMLAGLIRAPSWLNPLEHPERAETRAAVVLSAMEDAGLLSAEERSAAALSPASLDPARDSGTAGAWFADWALESARATAASLSGTVRVRTTMDPSLQAQAQEVINAALDSRGAESGVSQAALVALDREGSVIAMVGGRNYRESAFNRAVMARRQPGSTFKTFVYYAAMKEGISPNAQIIDEPIEIDGWSPKNFDDAHHGRVGLADAFARSLNVPAVVLANEIGMDKVIAAAHELGISSDLAEMPSLALGTSELSLLELTAAYAAIRAGEAPIEPRGIRTISIGDGGQSFNVGGSDQERIQLGEPAEIMAGMLEFAVARGTGRAAQIDGMVVAGKTGTSQDFKDAWFIGFNDEMTVGVWVGNDDGTPMNDVTGGNLPAQIWRAFVGGAAFDGAVAGLPEDDDGIQDGEIVTDGALIPPEEVPGVEMVEPVPEAPSRERTLYEQIQRATGFGGDQRGYSGAPAQCNVNACARAYRSFRASDCSYQPYSGPRRLCTR